VLNLTGGPKGSLATSVDQCTAGPTFDASFTSHGGITRTAKVPARVLGCGPSAAASTMKVSGSLSGVKHKKPVLRLALSSPSNLRELRLSLPSSLRPVSAKRVRAASLLLGGRKLKGASIRYTNGRLSFKAPKGKSTRSIRVTLTSKVLRMKKAIKVGQRVTLSLTAIGSNGKATPVKITLRARK
jgi:hypothetical protein